MIGPLRERFPGCRILLSTTTNTGYLMAQGAAGEADRRGGVRAVRSLGRHAPGGAGHPAGPAGARVHGDLAEPHPRREAQRSAGGDDQRPLLAEATWGSTGSLFSLIGNPLRDIDLFLMREDEEAERALAPGRAERAGLGDRATPSSTRSRRRPAQEDEALRRALGLRPGRAGAGSPAARTRARRSILLAVYRRLLPTHPDLRLVIAPRYIDRAGRIAALAREAGLTVGLRSQEQPRAARRWWCSTRSASWRERTGWRRWSSSEARSPRAAGRTSWSPRGRGSRCSSGRTWRTSATACRCWWAAAASR